MSAVLMAQSKVSRDEHEHSDSEWEYEYDAEETEDIYVTLDLTTHAPTTLGKRKRSRPSSAPGSETPAEANKNVQQSPEASAAMSEPPAKDRVQILDLHTLNPLVSYRGQLYSCHWASAIGTDLLFEAKSSSERSKGAENTADSASGPAYETTAFKLHAATPHRLVARPVKLVPKSDLEPSDAETVKPTETQPGSIVEDQRRRARAAFLSRLAEITAAKRRADAETGSAAGATVVRDRREAGNVHASGHGGGEDVSSKSNIEQDDNG